MEKLAELYFHDLVLREYHAVWWSVLFLAYCLEDLCPAESLECRLHDDVALLPEYKRCSPGKSFVRGASELEDGVVEDCQGVQVSFDGAAAKWSKFRFSFGVEEQC